MGCVQGSGRRGGLGGLPTPLVVLRAGGMRRTLLLLPALQKWQLGVLVSLYLVVHSLPQLHMHAVIFSLIRFLCILSLKETCVQGQALQRRVPGPRSQPVSSPGFYSLASP